MPAWLERSHGYAGIRGKRNQGGDIAAADQERLAIACNQQQLAFSAQRKRLQQLQSWLRPPGAEASEPQPQSVSAMCQQPRRHALRFRFVRFMPARDVHPIAPKPAA